MICPHPRRAKAAAVIAMLCASVLALAAVFVAPAVVLVLADGDGLSRRPWLVAVATVVSGAVLARLLVSGHMVGTRVREARSRHRELVDIVAEHEREGLRVLQHPTPTAYCIPGRASRVVLSQGVLDTLPGPELTAVMAHEKAHLRARHDLLLEFLGAKRHST